MGEWSSGDVTVNGTRIHYYRTGGDKPPLVLAHGATDNGLCWTRLTRDLEAEYDVIMPDARGHGLSDAPDSGYTNDDQAADLAGLIRALDLRRPAVGGHSMGAGTSLALIATEPELASCAILEDPAWLPTPPPNPPPDRPNPREALKRTVLEAQASGVEATIQRARVHSPSWSDEEWQPWAEAKMQVRHAVLDALTGDRPLFRDWRPQLAAARCPVLLVSADPARGAIVTPEIASEAVSIMPSLQVARLPDAGHNIRREQYDAFLSTVRGFLAVNYPAVAHA